MTEFAAPRRVRYTWAPVLIAWGALVLWSTITLECWSSFPIDEFTSICLAVAILIGSILSWDSDSRWLWSKIRLITDERENLHRLEAALEVQLERVLYSMLPCFIATAVAGVLSSYAWKGGHPLIVGILAATAIAMCGLANFVRLDMYGAKPAMIEVSDTASDYLLSWPQMVAFGTGLGGGLVLARGDSGELILVWIIFFVLYTKDMWTLARYSSDDKTILVASLLGTVGTLAFLSLRTDIPRSGPTINYFNSFLGLPKTFPISIGFVCSVGAAFGGLIIAELMPPLIFKAKGKPYPLSITRRQLRYRYGTKEAEVEEAEYQALSLLAANDAQSLRSLLGEQYLLVDEHSIVYSKPFTLVEDMFAAARRFKSASIVNVTVCVDGPTAVALGEFSVVIIDETGKEKLSSGRRFDVWVYRGNRWRLIATQLTDRSIRESS